jgi:predicted DNA-binding protein YlxM (UPF0122 family)
MNTGYKQLAKDKQKDVQRFRDRAEILRNRALLLDEPHRTLIISYLDNENSFRQIAKLTGVNEATISRKIKKIINRLEKNTHLVTGSNIKNLSDKQRRIAKDFFLKGISVRRLSRKYRMSYYKVKNIIHTVESIKINHSKKISERKY